MCESNTKLYWSIIPCEYYQEIKREESVQLLQYTPYKCTVLRWLSTATYKNLCMVCLSFIYALKYLQSVLLYYIVEQASCYYHSKFHSDTVFLRKDIAPNKYNI